MQLTNNMSKPRWGETETEADVQKDIFYVSQLHRRVQQRYKELQIKTQWSGKSYQLMMMTIDMFVSIKKKKKISGSFPYGLFDYDTHLNFHWCQDSAFVIWA